MTTDLDQLSDQQLSEAVAVEVAGWKRVDYPHGSTFIMGSDYRGEPPPYATSADAVLPLLLAHTKYTDENHGGEPEVFRFYSPADDKDHWTCEIVWLHHDGPIEVGQCVAATLPRACCLALLRAKRATSPQP